MTTAAGNPGLQSIPGGGDPGRAVVVPVPPDLYLPAAARLIGDQSAGDPLEAAKRFLESADQIGVDFSLMWCTLETATRSIRQVCLVVMGSGKTAMFFISGPERRNRSWIAARARAVQPSPEAARTDRVALIQHACKAAAGDLPATKGGARLAQALLEPKELEAEEAFRAAGFLRLGDLAYMRRPLPLGGLGKSFEASLHPTWPDGIRVRSITELMHEGATGDQIDEWLITALERSYEQTQDCPELCGMRNVHDVLESHRSVGIYDPSIWWLVFDDQGPQGCMLLTACPEHQSVELVYIGLSPRVRAKRLGSTLMSFGMRALYETVVSIKPRGTHACVSGAGGLTCAVDTRNTPAMRLYHRLGFERFATRIPLVRALASES